MNPEGIKSYVVQNSLTDKEVIKLVREEKSPRWPEWECYYCPYQQFCSKSNFERQDVKPSDSSLNEKPKGIKFSLAIFLNDH